jgi:ABC-type sugar transport system permease subunit
MSRVELITAIARGELPDLDRELDAWLNAEIAARWTANHPRATGIIAAAVIDQERRFGSSLDELDKLARAPDVLSISLIGVGLLGAVGVLCVLAVSGLRRHWVSYAFIAAPTALVGVFVVIPAITALYLSFTEYHPVLPLAAARWVGLDQYARVFGSRELYHSLGRTVMYVLMSLPPMVLISLALASVLNAARHGQRLWRFIFFCPLVTSMISVALIFTQLFHATEIGWINAVLIETGLVRDPVRFLESDRWFLPTAAILAIWGGLAFNILIYIAGLQQIPASLYEAARIDGASSVRRFWHVSLPGLRPQILFTGVIGLIGGFQVFETIFMLGGGTGYAGSKFGPNDAGMTMVPLVFRYGFEYFQMGKASAYSYILFAVILVFTVIQFRLFRDGDRS